MTLTTWILLFLSAALIAVIIIPPLRRNVISRLIMKMVRRGLPSMGDTERIALEAGTVWWDGELFSGKPDWHKLLDFEIKPLTDEEQAFLDGPTEELCHMIDDWQITQDRDLPETFYPLRPLLCESCYLVQLPVFESPEANCPAPVENWIMPSEFESANPFIAAFKVMMEETLPQVVMVITKKHLFFITTQTI